MSTCDSCGHQNTVGANFCSSCGVQLVSAREDVTDVFQLPEVDPDSSIEIDRRMFPPDAGIFVVVQGSKSGSRYALDADLISVGRHPDSDIFLDDVTVSRRHVEVHRDGASSVVADVGSLNGTYLNKERIERSELTDGDELQVGKFKLRFFHGMGEG